MIRTKFKVKEFKNMKYSSLFPSKPNPQRPEVGHYYCYTAMADIPSILGQFILFPDDMELPEEGEIETMMMDSPVMFHLRAPKILLHVGRAVFDNRSDMVSLEISFENHEGIVLGKNTLFAILENRDNFIPDTPDGNVYVELEIISGLSYEEVLKLKDFRRGIVPEDQSSNSGKIYHFNAELSE